jgi:hypothetical protein
VTIEGTSLDHDGEIESVAVRINSHEWVVANNLGGDWNKWSFSFDSADYSNGTHRITITAIDNSSESTFSYLDIYFENEQVNEKQDEDDDFSYLPLLAVIVPLLLCVIMFLVIKRKKDRELRERYSEEEKENEEGTY